MWWREHYSGPLSAYTSRSTPLTCLVSLVGFLLLAWYSLVSLGLLLRHRAVVRMCGTELVIRRMLVKVRLTTVVLVTLTLVLLKWAPAPASGKCPTNRLVTLLFILQ